MKGLRTAVALGFLALACMGLFAAPAHAQTYPSKPVTIVVTLAAGGAADVIARALAQRLSEDWGQPVVVENKGGANNQVGTAAVAKSAPDGYTLLLTPEHTFTFNPYLYRKLSYDAAKDFIAVSGLVGISHTRFSTSNGHTNWGPRPHPPRKPRPGHLWRRRAMTSTN